VGDPQSAAIGAELTRDALTARFAAAHRDLAIQSPAVTPEHLAEAVLVAAGAGASQP